MALVCMWSALVWVVEFGKRVGHCYNTRVLCIPGNKWTNWSPLHLNRQIKWNIVYESQQGVKVFLCCGCWMSKVKSCHYHLSSLLNFSLWKTKPVNENLTGWISNLLVPGICCSSLSTSKVTSITAWINCRMNLKNESLLKVSYLNSVSN